MVDLLLCCFFLSVVVPLGCLLSKDADHRDINSWTAPKHPPSGFFPLWSSSLTAFRSPWPPISPTLPFFPAFLSLDIRAQCLMGWNLILLKRTKESVSVCCWCLFKKDSYASHLLLWVALGVFYTLTHFAEEKLDIKLCEGCELSFWREGIHFPFCSRTHALQL